MDAELPLLEQFLPDCEVQLLDCCYLACDMFSDAAAIVAVGLEVTHFN